ncbi:MAG: hypothetical protein ABIT20_02880 [Gemmatimonadaceae bacterium]
MSESPRPPVPTSIDRASVDRILARALELQAASANDPEGRLTEAQLEALAKEVGLDPVNLRQALAEERTRSVVPVSDVGLMASLYGGAGAAAERTVRGTPEQVLKALDDWMQREESLIPQRYFGERIVWEARRDFVGMMRRGISGRGHSLVRATSVGATAIALDANRVLVRLDAQLDGYRSVMAKQNIALTGGSVVAGGILAVLSFPVLAVMAPAAVVVPIAFAAARASHGNSVARAQLALEQVLDRLERGEAGRPPSLISMLAAAVGGRRPDR